MEEEKCEVCGRVFTGTTRRFVENCLAGHMNVHNHQ